MGEFKQGLCGCFSNLSLCCFANCLYPLAVGKNAEAMGEKHPVLWAIASGLAPCIASGLLREMIRKKNDIPGSFCGDCCMHLMFRPCAIAQDVTQTGVFDYIAPPKAEQMQRVAPGN